MPATGTALLHRLSLLLLVGLHLLVGSAPLASPADRSQVPAAEPPGSAVTQEDAWSASAPSPLPGELGSAEPSSGSGRAAATERRTSEPAIMSNQKAVGSSNTETRTSSSPMHNTDTFSTLVSGEGRTSRVITNSTSVSEEVIGTTASYTEMIRFGVLVQDSSSLLENKRADSSQRTVDITGPETVPLKVHSPKTAFSPLSEDNVTATGNTESRWDADSTMSRLPTASTGTSSARVNRHEERTSPLEMDKVTLTDSARTELVSQTEVTLAFDQTQFSPHATQSSRRSSTSGTAPSPNPSARVVLAHSLFPPKTAAEDSDQPRSSSKTEKSTFNSHTDSSLVSSRSVRGGERMLRTLRNIRSSYNATETASTFGSDISSDSGYTDSSYVLTPELTGGMNLPLGDTDSTAAALTHSQATSGAAVEVSHQPRSHSNMEESVSSSHSNSLPVSGPPDRSGERTLRTLRDIHSSHNATQISTTLSSETSSSSDLTGSSYVLTPEQTVGMNASLGEMHFTDTALLHSQAPLETTDAGNSQNTLGNFSTETRTAETESGFSSAILRRGGGTLRSLTNWSKSTDATERSAFDVEAVSSLHFTQTPSVTVNNETTSVSSTEVDFTESSEDPLLTYFNETSVSSSSTKDLSGTGSSHQPVDISDRERRISSASTDSVYLSTTFQHVGERTLRSLPDNITSPDGSGSSTSKTEVSESSDSSLTSPSVAETEEYKASLSEVQSTEPSTQHLLEHSSLVPLYLASPKDSSTIGSASVSSSGTEASVSHSSTNSMYSSAPLSRREQTLPPIINNTLLEVTESTSSYMEKSEASEQNPSSSEAYSQRTDFPVQDFDVSVPSTETFQSLSSSRIPTSSSFQSEPSDTGTGYQSMSSTDTGKRTSASHTDRTYISTTFTRGGERTLLSISNNSTSESSTFYAEISSPSESVQSSFSVTQSRGSNMSSSDRDFPAPSTEPLAVHSLKTAGYSSAASEPQTTQFYSSSESTSATTVSFLPSSPVPPQQDSRSSTPPPVWLSSSESVLPSSTSAFPSPLPPSSQTTLMAFSPGLSSTTPPPLPPFASLLPVQSSASSSLQPSESFESSFSLAASEGTTGIDLSIVGSSPSEYNHQTGTYPLKESTSLRATGPSLLLTETTEQPTHHSSAVMISRAETETSREQNVSLPGTSIEKTVPILTTSPTYLPEGTTEIAKATTSMFPSSTTQKDVFSLAEVTTQEKRTTTCTMLELTPLPASTDYSATLKPPTVPPPSSTKVSHTSGTPSKQMEMSSATNVKVTEPSISVTHPPKTFSPSQTIARPFPTLPVPSNPTTAAWLGNSKTSPVSHGKVSVCTADTCLNNGKCILDSSTGKFQCRCSPGWQGEDCSSDIDECLSSPCLASATCTNTLGSFQCVCPLGYWMEKGKCNLVRTFVVQFSLNFNTTGGKYSELHHIEEVITNMLNNSLSTLPGYYTSNVKASRQAGPIQVSVLSIFSLASNITRYEVVNTIQGHIRACKAPPETCQIISNLTLLYRGGGLCTHKDPECDKETSVCRDLDGLAVCQCKPGYFKYNKLDHSCRACEDGYKLENNTCVSCPFGLGGFNCGNPYQLITIVIAAAGGGLLLIMGIALIVTCCQKNKNDISKLIFKSGDFQMSPYAEYPKTPQAQDWGRETIEMQENGSTKNLLQMTDVYYMPTNVRNPELERNGVYPPYTGLPGSRHSCIYPGQYNPSFISDDSRRRDYF